MLSGSLYTWKLVSALWRANYIIMPQFLSDISLAILYWHFLCWHLLKYYPHIYLYLCCKIMKLIWSLIFLCWSRAFKSSLLSCVLGSVLLWILGVYVCMSNAKVVFTGDVLIQFFLPDPDSEMWTCVNWLQVLQCLNQAELNQCIHRCAGVTIWFQHFFFGRIRPISNTGIRTTPVFTVSSQALCHTHHRRIMCIYLSKLWCWSIRHVMLLFSTVAAC